MMKGDEMVLGLTVFWVKIIVVKIRKILIVVVIVIMVVMTLEVNGIVLVLEMMYNSI